MVVALVAVSVLVFFNSPPGQRLSLEHWLKGEVTDVRPEAVARAEGEYRATSDAILTNTLLDRRLYHAVFDTCYLDHRDQGWFAAGYDFHCLTVSLGVYEVDPDALTTTNALGDTVVYGLEDLALPNAQLATSAGRFDAWLLPGGTRTELEEQVLDQSLQGSVVAYGQPDALANRVTITSGWDADPDADRVQIGVAWASEYYTTDVGCRAMSLFCQAPIPEDFAAR